MFERIISHGFNAAVMHDDVETWTLEFFPTATLNDLADCLAGLKIKDDGGFLFSVSRGDIQGAIVDVAAPVDGSAAMKLKALAQHEQIQSIVGESRSHYRLLHQKPGQLCGLLQQAVKGDLPVTVEDVTVLGPDPGCND